MDEVSFCHFGRCMAVRALRDQRLDNVRTDVSAGWALGWPMRMCMKVWMGLHFVAVRRHRAGTLLGAAPLHVVMHMGLDKMQYSSRNRTVQ